MPQITSPHRNKRSRSALRVVLALVSATVLALVAAPDQQIPLALVKQQLTWVVPVADLPVGSRISEIQPTPDGLRVSATAENVRLNDLQQK